MDAERVLRIGFQPTVGEYATFVLYEKAFESELARRELARALTRDSQPELLATLERSIVRDTKHTPGQIAAVRQILDAATPRPKKRAPTRVKSTG